MSAWRAWYHVTFTTHGTWLRGDPRGWRTRHHREHVEGDYKNPPAKGEGDELFAQSKRLMTRPQVVLNTTAQRLACDTMAATFAWHDIQAIAFAIDDHHAHILVRCPDGKPRHWVGVAKKNSARAITDKGLVSRGKVWAVRSRAAPIKDREHQIAAYRYILRHSDRGATVRSFSSREVT